MQIMLTRLAQQDTLTYMHITHTWHESKMMGAAATLTLLNVPGLNASPRV